MNISKKISLIFSLLFLTFSTACVETVVVGTIATGAVITREKNLTSTRDDMIISTQAGVSLVENGLKNVGNMVDVTVNEGRVLLTGIVRDSTKAKLASELVWKVQGVKEVIDEIQLRDGVKMKPKDFSIGFFDYIITSTIEAKMLINKKVSTYNYQITTVNKTVYLLGVAGNSDEMDAVLSIASKTSGVKKVVNHIILLNDSRRHG